MVLSITKNKLKERSIVLVLLAVLFLSVYFYLNHLQKSYSDAQWSGERCITELTSIKYQLNVVTEYKNRLDKLLTETQAAHNMEKGRYKDIMDSCVAMKQQTTICQNQFEDLQVECKKVKEDYDKLKRELEQLKSTG